MNVEDGIEMITHIYEKQREERNFTLYAATYPNMTKDNFIQFEEFYKPTRRNETLEEKTSEEILNEVKEAMDSNEWG